MDIIRRIALISYVNIAVDMDIFKKIVLHIAVVIASNKGI